jgi:hypothetical protein
MGWCCEGALSIMDARKESVGEKREGGFEKPKFNPETGRWEGEWLKWWQILTTEDKRKLVCGI